MHVHTETIEGYFREHPPKSIQEACLKIEELTSLKRGETPVRKFLKSIGMSLRKTGAVPGKADPAVQEEFKKNTRASFGRCQRRQKGSILRRCCSFCMAGIRWFLMVFC